MIFQWLSRVNKSLLWSKMKIYSSLYYLFWIVISLYRERVLKSIVNALTAFPTSIATSSIKNLNFHLRNLPYLTLNFCCLNGLISTWPRSSQEVHCIFLASVWGLGVVGTYPASMRMTRNFAGLSWKWKYLLLMILNRKCYETEAITWSSGSNSQWLWGNAKWSLRMKSVERRQNQENLSPSGFVWALN